MLKNIIYSLLVSIFSIILGCSGGSLNPITPPADNNPGVKINSDIPSPIIVSSYDKDGYPVGGLGTLGMFYGELNLKTLDVSLTPLRAASNGLKDSIIVDITTYLSMSPCSNCIDLQSVSMDNYNRPVLTIGISHPFPPGSQFSPPSASNRLDLHLFTVRGFVISNGIIGGGAKIFPGLNQEIPAWRLVNASGYAGEFDTNWDDVLETRATIHPYVQHYDDYSFGNYSNAYENGFQNPALPTGNTVMGMGSTFDYKDYVIEIQPSVTEIFQFIYAISVSYGLSAKGKPQFLNPTYRVPLYCGKSASVVRLGSIDNRLDDMNASSWADLTIEVLDINHGIAIGEEIDQMDFDSSVKSIFVEAPDLSDSTFNVDDALTVYQGGNCRIISDPLRYKVRITNTKLAPPGKYTGLIKILDAYPKDANVNLGGNNAIPAGPPNGEDPTNGIFAVEEWATYGVFDYTVALGNRPPNCELNLLEYTILGGSSATAFPGSGTNDPDGSIVLYEYDKDYDGETFNVDASNTTGEQVVLGPYDNESGSSINIIIAMRVTDDDDPAANTICTAELTVQHFSPVIYFEDFNDNDNGWQFDTENFWGIKNGFLGSSAGDGAMAYGIGCYADDLGENERIATSNSILIPAIPSGYASIRVTIVHAVNTEIFAFNPFSFTDDCDLWVKPSGTEKYKLITTGGDQYNTNSYTSKDGPSFAGILGVVPAFGEPFSGKTSYFDSPDLADQGIRLKFRQQTDDGIDNCRGGWWIDSVKVEFIK